jgi:hypothetical protein
MHMHSHETIYSPCCVLAHWGKKLLVFGALSKLSSLDEFCTINCNTIYLVVHIFVIRQIFFKHDHFFKS